MTDQRWSSEKYYCWYQLNQQVLISYLCIVQLNHVNIITRFIKRNRQKAIRSMQFTSFYFDSLSVTLNYCYFHSNLTMPRYDMDNGLWSEGEWCDMICVLSLLSNLFFLRIPREQEQAHTICIMYNISRERESEVWA